MKTLFANGRGGVFMADAQEPASFDKCVMVRVTHSLISAGTERGIIRNAKYETEAASIAAGCRLGYSAAGIVEKVIGDCRDLKVGDRVGCYGGPYTYHGELLAVPCNLAYKVPANLDMESAAFVGLGAISMHGFRMGACELGSVCVVIGAGVIGNLCAQMALLAGSRVIVSDFAKDRLERMKECVPSNADLICTTPDKLDDLVMQETHGVGADTVLLCLATDRREPMDQAVRIGRMRAKVVVVGVLDLHFDREPFFLRETQITISRAGGPGRYDVNYERNGVDYPVHLARWTEGRNMEEVLRLLGRKALNTTPLMGHKWNIEDYAKAYDMVLNNKSDLGHLFIW